MGCLEIKAPTGETRFIPENTPYPAGWRFTGTLDLNCAGMIQNPGQLTQNVIEAELEKNGIKWGDAVAWVTKRVGIKQCAPCKARQEILNHASENGWVETIRKIKETY